MTATGREPGRLLGSGRTADVYEIDERWVLRRNREAWADSAAEGALLAYLREHGCPVPAVRPSGSRTDLVMERLQGPTLLQAFAAGAVDARQAGETLAGLLRRLHTVPGRRSPDARVLHLDLHPDNVILTDDGPRIIDWDTAGEGDPALDWAMSAVILAQVATSAEPIAAPAGEVLTALLADPAPLTEEALREALRRRAGNPTMSARELELLPAAADLIRRHMTGSAGRG